VLNEQYAHTFCVNGANVEWH